MRHLLLIPALAIAAVASAAMQVVVPQLPASVYADTSDSTSG